MIIDDIIKKILKEANTSVTAGLYNGPVEIGLKKWKESELGPFYKFVDTEFNHNKKQKTLKNNIKKTVGVWEKNADGTYDVDEHDVHAISEDLAVWFGTKKKPKGSKQPKGPWVDICRKVNGKHPPCGRSDADKGSYPKCRAAGVAGKMSDSQKRSACQQKRRAEKKDTQTGKGQKPIMTSYKPKNENMKKRIVTLTENDLMRIVKRVLNEQTSTLPKNKRIDLKCINYTNSPGVYNLYMDMVSNSSNFNGNDFTVRKNPNSIFPDGGASGGLNSVTLFIKPPSEEFIQNIQKNLPQVDFNKTKINKILHTTVSGGSAFCRVESNGTDPEWEEFFTTNGISTL
jgi:hypothetical protein